MIADSANGGSGSCADKEHMRTAVVFYEERQSKAWFIFSAFWVTGMLTGRPQKDIALPLLPETDFACAGSGPLFLRQPFADRPEVNRRLYTQEHAQGHAADPRRLGPVAAGAGGVDCFAGADRPVHALKPVFTYKKGLLPSIHAGS